MEKLKWGIYITPSWDTNMEAENGQAHNYLLMPLSRDHELIMSLSRDNKACFLMIMR